MKQYLNVTDVEGARIAPVDVITFGSPCQDLSVAGRREGLEGERSNLFYEAIRIIREMREETNGQQPRYAVWENVTGAFSSNKGKDFGAVIDAVVELAEQEAPDVPVPTKGWASAGHIRGDVGSGWSIAWRTFDAQHWGVPQRRNRILLVADFRGDSAGEILFKPDGLSGDFATSETEREGTSGNAERSVRGTGTAIGFHLTQDTIFLDDKTPCLSCGSTKGQASLGVGHSDPVVYGCNSWNCYSPGFVTLRASGGDYGGGSENLVCIGDVANTQKGAGSEIYCLQGSMIGRAEKNGPQGDGINQDVAFTLTSADRHAVCYNLCSMASNAMKSDNPHSATNTTETARALDTAGGNPACNQGGTMILHPTALSVDTSHADDVVRVDEKVPALQARDYKGGKNVLFDNQRGLCRYTGPLDTAPTICAKYGTGGNNVPYVIDKPYLRVRRLTPIECARLQGFPDWWGELPIVEDMSDEDYDFWCLVREEVAKLNGKEYKQKTKPQTVKWYNKLHSDSSEYKMWGNGVALPMVRFVMQGIAKQGAKTMGSLFDGSGGFPLASVLEGIKPLWSSEIQPYPLAVTRERFKEITE